LARAKKKKTWGGKAPKTREILGAAVGGSPWTGGICLFWVGGTARGIIGAGCLAVRRNSGGIDLCGELTQTTGTKLQNERQLAETPAWLARLRLSEKQGFWCIHMFRIT
jgi:hypothetical protein